MLSLLHNNGNEEITHESTYTTEKISELYDTEELLEGTFPLSFKLVDHYQWEEPILTEKLNSAEYIKGYFQGGRNTINFVTFNDKIVIRQLLQMYVVKWYHRYLLRSVLDRKEAMIFPTFVLSRY